MIPLNADSLQKFLKALNKEAHIQTETGQVYYLQKISGADFPIFLRPNEENKQLQIVLFIPTNIESGAEADLARLLLYINKEIDLPGFGMDEGANIVFYRQVLPSLDLTLSEDTVSSYLKGMEVITEMFAGVILNVAAKKVTFNQVMRKIQSQSQNIQP